MSAYAAVSGSVLSFMQSSFARMANLETLSERLRSSELAVNVSCMMGAFLLTMSQRLGTENSKLSG
ncbi:uncharacterized protein N7483_001507 [Penicillium malachiteum]|uniref:uncharacterized protein n=1 Tax=Penicillium malachiteum TaxID=1324776 RepID=UPI002547CD7A|nr:uncharacterized protein N7483_001507 [Penicillium malachiteum]KAJ5736382.1 hypothetical protein N7483_001507 [Penicillium malachiteum]